MTSALVPIWILGASFVAMIVLNSLFNSGTSAMSDRDGRGFGNPNAEIDGMRARRGPGAPLAG